MASMMLVNWQVPRRGFIQALTQGVALRLLALSLGGCLLGGCAGIWAVQAPPSAPERLFNDALFGAPTERVQAQQVLALSPAMHEFITHDIRRSSWRDGLQRAQIGRAHV